MFRTLLIIAAILVSTACQGVHQGAPGTEGLGAALFGRAEQRLGTYGHVYITGQHALDSAFSEAVVSGLTEIGFEVVDEQDILELAPRGMLHALALRVQTHGSGDRLRMRLTFVDHATMAEVYRTETEVQRAGVLTDKNPSSETSSGKAASDPRLEALALALDGVFENYGGQPLAARGAVGAREVSPVVGTATDGGESRSEGAPGEVEAAVRTEIDEWENFSKSRKELVEYFKRRGERLDPVEGIWTDSRNRYTLAVFRNTVAARRDFVGIVLSDARGGFHQGDVRLEIAATARSGDYTADFYPAPARGRKIGGTLAIDEEGRLNGSFRAADDETQAISFLRNYPREKTSPSRGTARKPSSYGTGFLVDSEGYVATNYHVVRGAERVRAYFPAQDREYEAEVFLKDKRNDLAILRVKAPREVLRGLGPIPYALRGGSEHSVGQEVFTIGFPLGEELGDGYKVSTGVISGLTGVSGDPGRMQVSTPIQPGNSGGAVFNDRGEIVGVMVAGLDDRYYLDKGGFVPQNVNFAVKRQYLDSLLEMIPGRADVTTDKPRSTAAKISREQRIRNYLPFMVMLKVSAPRKEPVPAMLRDPEA